MNVGREPWGFSLNAEVWNGRIAMLAFFWVLIQEAIVGKGSITVFQEAEHWWQLIVPSIIGGTFFVMVAFVTNTIASQDGDDFSTDEILTELTGEAPAGKAPAPAQETAAKRPRADVNPTVPDAPAPTPREASEGLSDGAAAALLADFGGGRDHLSICLLYTSPSPRDRG